MTLSSKTRKRKARDGNRRRELVGSLLRFHGLPADVQRRYDERAAEIRRVFAAGAALEPAITVSEIADVLGVPRTVVYRAINGKGE